MSKFFTPDVRIYGTGHLLSLKEAEMRCVLMLAIEPTDNRETICEVLRVMKPFMVEQTKEIFG